MGANSRLGAYSNKYGNVHFSNHLDTVNGPPLPSPNNVGTKKQGKVNRGAQTTTLLRGEGKGGTIKADRVNCPKNFVLHCWLHDLQLHILENFHFTFKISMEN